MSQDTLIAEVLKVDARALKMPGVARNHEPLARQALEERWTHQEYLHEVLSAEVSSRLDSAIRERIRKAGFPEQKALGDFDFSVVEGVTPAAISDLARCDWVRKAGNVVMVGPIGTGKTHLAIALGVEAARQKLHVVFWRAADMVRTLVEAQGERELGRLQRRLRRVDLLIVDELGFVPFDRTGGELLFNVLADRYERKSVLLTSNLSFGEWPKVFGEDEKLTTALLDRLAHHATIMSTRGESYRLRQRKAQGTKTGGTPDKGQAESVAPEASQRPSSENKGSAEGPPSLATLTQSERSPTKEGRKK